MGGFSLPQVYCRPFPILGLVVMFKRRQLLKISALGTASLAAPLAYPASNTPRGDLEAKVSRVLSAQPVNPREFSSLVTDKPNPEDPTTWCWAPAINHAAQNYSEVDMSSGVFGLSRPIVVPPGCVIRGKGPGYAGGASYSSIRSTVLRPRADFVGDAIFVSRVEAPDNVLTAPQFEQFKLDLSLCNKHGIVLEDVYDGVIMRNVHVTGVSKTKRGIWLKTGSYGLGQTLLAENCQVIGRSNSDGVVAPFLAESLNESTLIGCKFFGSSGGKTASMGPAAEFSGCSGVTLLGCSFAFADVGPLISDHPTRKSIGIAQVGCTYEALRTSAVKVRGSATRKASLLSVVSPRYYDSVFAMTNAIDADNVESSFFDCKFKKAIIGKGADQCQLQIQRQNYVSNAGANTLVTSPPSAADPYLSFNSAMRVGGKFTSDGGVHQNVRTLVDSPSTLLASDRVVIVNRAVTGNYILPAASENGPGKTQLVTVKNIGTAIANFSVKAGETLDGGTTACTMQPGAQATFFSDSVSAWFVS